MKFAGTIEQERAAAEAAGNPVAFVSAGDNVSASLFASAVQGDQPTIDVLNALGLQASAVGNHEFDKGFTDLTDRIIAGGTNAKWAYLGANVYLKGTTTPGAAGVHGPRHGRRQGRRDRRRHPGDAVAGQPGRHHPARHRQPGRRRQPRGRRSSRTATRPTARPTCSSRRYHEGAGAGTPDGATFEQEVAAGGAFAQIVNGTSPAVDAIFTGHTHKQYAWDAPVPGEAGVTRPIIQTGELRREHRRGHPHLRPRHRRRSPRTPRRTSRASSHPSIAGNTAAQNEAAFGAQLVATYPRVAQVKHDRQRRARLRRHGRAPCPSARSPPTSPPRTPAVRTARAATSAPGPTPTRVATTARASRRSATSSPTPCGTPSPRRTSAARRSASSTPAAFGRSCSTAPDGVITTAEANSRPAVRQQPLDHDAHRRPGQDDARAAVAADADGTSRRGRTCSWACPTT